jgi:hypothetical protein
MMFRKAQSNQPNLSTLDRGKSLQLIGRAEARQAAGQAPRAALSSYFHQYNMTIPDTSCLIIFEALLARSRSQDLQGFMNTF